MSHFRLVNAQDVSPEHLNQFLCKVYPPEKYEFLEKYAEWRYRGKENQLLILDGEQVVAYCAFIPTTCVIKGTPREALWWVDLIVLPEYRGQGLQRILDQQIQDKDCIKLGFPNEIAMGIHQKHGWGVSDEGEILLSPLFPTHLRTVQRGRFWLKSAAMLLSPIAALYRAYLSRYAPKATWEIKTPSPNVLADVFMKYNLHLITSYRDAAFIQWRYLDAPYRSDLRFYVGGTKDAPTHVLITRDFNYMGGKAVQILDFYGDFTKLPQMSEMIRTVLRDAVLRGAYQVTTFSFLPELITILRRNGLFISTKTRFCWQVTSTESIEIFNEQGWHWIACDSDSDEAV